jgi:hypothetical protein
VEDDPHAESTVYGDYARRLWSEDAARLLQERGWPTPSPEVSMRVLRGFLRPGTTAHLLTLTRPSDDQEIVAVLGSRNRRGDRRAGFSKHELNNLSWRIARIGAAPLAPDRDALRIPREEDVGTISDEKRWELERWAGIRFSPKESLSRWQVRRRADIRVILDLALWLEPTVSVEMTRVEKRHLRKTAYARRIPLSREELRDELYAHTRFLLDYRWVDLSG